jgi:hypothetical protein
MYFIVQTIKNINTFTTAIIFQYVYFIPQKAKSVAITYFCVACYSINWIHNLRRHVVYSNMGEKQDIYVFPSFSFIILRILSRI